MSIYQAPIDYKESPQSPREHWATRQGTRAEIRQSAYWLLEEFWERGFTKASVYIHGRRVVHPNKKAPSSTRSRPKKPGPCTDCRKEGVRETRTCLVTGHRWTEKFDSYKMFRGRLCARHREESRWKGECRVLEDNTDGE